MTGTKWLVLVLTVGLADFTTVANTTAAEVSTASQTPVRQAARIINGKDRNVGRLIPDLELADLSGKAHRLSELTRGKGVVVAVTSTSCPLSKKYLPTLIRLAREYHDKGFGFVLLNPLATDKPTAIQDAANDLGLAGVYVHDAQGTLSSAFGLTSTTDVLILDSSRTVLYHGAVDDQYGFGYSLEAARKNYLVTALDEVLKGSRIVVTATEAPGCLLDHEVGTATITTVTYHNRISRLIQTNCGDCHRQGGVGPFSLETHADVVSHAKMIETVVSQGTMPPWFAVPLPGKAPSPWINDCSLSEDDKTDLLAWLKGDKAVGDPHDAPRPVDYASGWEIGKPDLVVKFPSAVPIQATGVMRYKNVVVDAGLTEDRWIQGIEIHPGAPEVVHHILVFAHAPRGSGNRKESPNDEINYWAIYVPGNNKIVYPPGFARKLPKGSKIRFQVHYTPSGTATEDLTQMALIYADKAPENEVKTASLVNAWFEIPPGASNFQDSAKIKLPGDATVMGYLPHMHVRGTSCRYEAITDGKSEVLLDVPRYDFNWQLMYRYAEPRTFAKGTTLKFTAGFDNSDKNPANPDPKATVHWGEQTTDEMIIGYLEYYVPAGGQTDRLASIEPREPGLAGDRSEHLFMALDANDDGKLSLEELKKLSDNPRMKQVNPVMIGVFFKALDKDQDNFLTIEEFQKIRELLQKKK